jgi:putative Mg2+ transporter-C (MgtC) family protein
VDDFSIIPAADELHHALLLGVALVLSASIGLERQLRAKSAGLRTHTLVGVGAALFMLVSKFGFADVTNGSSVVLDPSRVAAQIVSGIGFLGAGLIFVRRDDVRGLTTAASIWLTAAIGMSAGAGLVLLAGVATLCHFVVVLGLAPLGRRIAGRSNGRHQLQLVYTNGAGVLRQSLVEAHRLGFALSDLEIRKDTGDSGGAADHRRQVHVEMSVEGQRPVSELIGVIGELPGMVRVRSDDEDWDAA